MRIADSGEVINAVGSLSLKPELKTLAEGIRSWRCLCSTYRTELPYHSHACYILSSLCIATVLFSEAHLDTTWIRGERVYLASFAEVVLGICSTSQSKADKYSRVLGVISIKFNSSSAFSDRMRRQVNFVVSQFVLGLWETLLLFVKRICSSNDCAFTARL